MDLEAALRTHGHRVTRPRRVVWDVLETAGEHLSAQTITQRVHAIDAAINESSVYRAITLFADLGIVRESRLEDVATWEPFHDDTAIHVICSGCGTVIHHHTDLVKELRLAVQRDVHFVPDEVDVRVAGRCRECAS